MKSFEKIIVIALIVVVGCNNREEADRIPEIAKNRFEKISFYKYPPTDTLQQPFKYRLSYYYKNGFPAQWMELDSAGEIMTDYIYQYDSLYRQTGAIYFEDKEKEYAQELVHLENDSTQVTQWTDSTDAVYYTMIDNLNKAGKTYRATFIGDTIHGYDSTSYTKEGFEKRIFFTNVKGHIYNDRSFMYDVINEKGDWARRRKIMNDSVVEYQEREVYYDDNFTATAGYFYEGIISTYEWDENVISFTEDEKITFFTRTTDWLHQSGYLSTKSGGIYTKAVPINALDSIYNGAISPDGNKIIYSKRTEDAEEIWLLTKNYGEWAEKTNLTASSGIGGGYFNWLNKEELYFYVPDNNGDIVEGSLLGSDLTITNTLETINTQNATEFSPFIDRGKRFIIFSRFLEGDDQQQGFFVSYNQNNFDDPKWSTPKKILGLPYGWSAYINKAFTRFIFSDGKNIHSVPIDRLGLTLSPN